MMQVSSGVGKKTRQCGLCLHIHVSHGENFVLERQQLSIPRRRGLPQLLRWPCLIIYWGILISMIIGTDNAYFSISEWC